MWTGGDVVDKRVRPKRFSKRELDKKTGDNDG